MCKSKRFAKNEIQVTIDPAATPVPSNKKLQCAAEKKSKEKKRNKQNRFLLLCMLFLTFGYFVVEIVVGYMTNSVALVADSFHMLSDVISLIIAYVAVRMSPNKWTRNTFGWARAEVLGALVNAVFLVALCFTIVVDSLKRFIKVEDIENPKLILIVGCIGLGVNLIGLALLHEHGHSHSKKRRKSESNQNQQSANKAAPPTGELSIGVLENGNKKKSQDLVNSTLLPPTDPKNEDKKSIKGNLEGTPSESQEKSKSTSATQMNMHGVFLHVLADAMGSVVVIISALVIWLTEWKFRMYVDPLLSLILVILIICSVWPLFVESALVLLQTVPAHIQIEELKQKLLSNVSGVYQIHEFHVWSLSGNRIIATAHILCNSQEDFMRIGEDIKDFFHNEGIHSTTIQLEWTNETKNRNEGTARGRDSSDSDDDEKSKSECFLACPFDDVDAECVNNSCCGIPTSTSITASKLLATSVSKTDLGLVDVDLGDGAVEKQKSEL